MLRMSLIAIDLVSLQKDCTNNRENNGLHTISFLSEQGSVIANAIIKCPAHGAWPPHLCVGQQRRLLCVRRGSLQRRRAAPLQLSQQPLTGTQTPVTNTNTGHRRTQAPVTGAQTPVTDTQTPVTDKQTPATSAQTPVTGAHRHRSQAHRHRPQAHRHRPQAHRHRSQAHTDTGHRHTDTGHRHTDTGHRHTDTGHRRTQTPVTGAGPDTRTPVTGAGLLPAPVTNSKYAGNTGHKSQLRGTEVHSEGCPMARPGSRGCHNSAAADEWGEQTWQT